MTSAEPEDLLFGLAQFINQSGVIATGDLLVEAQATPDMTVKVAVGRAVLKTSDGRNGYPVYNDASANVTIAANGTGGTKIDAVVLYWDGAAVADANATNVAKLTTVRGTGAATPTDTEIQTAVGAGNPFLRLADVTVANGAVSINSGNIADKRVYADPSVRRPAALPTGITADKLALSLDESVLASNYTVGAADGVYADTGVAITLPAAGTYLLFGTFRGFVDFSAGSFGFVKTKLFNSSDAADVSNSHRFLVISYQVGVKANASASLMMKLTVAAAKTIKLYAARDGSGVTWTSAFVVSDGDGKTNLGYLRVG